ncbi:transposase [Streptomyces sp. NPDC051020]|uniref:transposase n=1 Tax=Streptomyces sp. NPDC051020 TaxID=3155409 RepID=UPI003419D2A3
MSPSSSWALSDPDRGAIHQGPVPAVSGPPRCTSSRDSARNVGLPPRELRDLQVRVRTEQQTPGWKARYAVRSSVEGTINEFAHGHGMRHCRYRGQPKAHLQHVLTAIAVNIERLSGRPVTEEAPSPRRRPPFRPSWTSVKCPGRSPGEPSEANLDHLKIPDRVKLRSHLIR